MSDLITGILILYVCVCVLYVSVWMCVKKTSFFETESLIESGAYCFAKLASEPLESSCPFPLKIPQAWGYRFMLPLPAWDLDSGPHKYFNHRAISWALWSLSLMGNQKFFMSIAVMDDRTSCNDEKF